MKQKSCNWSFPDVQILIHFTRVLIISAFVISCSIWFSLNSYSNSFNHPAFVLQPFGISHRNLIVSFLIFKIQNFYCYFYLIEIADKLDDSCLLAFNFPSYCYYLILYDFQSFFHFSGAKPIFFIMLILTFLHFCSFVLFKLIFT